MDFNTSYLTAFGILLPLFSTGSEMQQVGRNKGTIKPLCTGHVGKKKKKNYFITPTAKCFLAAGSGGGIRAGASLDYRASGPQFSWLN